MNVDDVYDSARTFLQNTRESDPIALFQSYAQFLLHSSGVLNPPIQLDMVRNQHNLQRHVVPLSQRGFLLGDTIFINSDDPSSIQRFTEAHEMMETLFIALQNEVPSRISFRSTTELKRNKERWCERGAAELLMPVKIFFPMVKNKGISLVSGRDLASLYQTSLTATIRRMLESDATQSIFALLKEGYKKSEHVPSRAGQGVLWGDPKDWDPPAQLRVWRRWSSPQVQAFVCENESVGRDTSIYHTFKDGAIGKITNSSDTLDLQYIKGTYTTESMLVKISNTSVVMALIHF